MSKAGITFGRVKSVDDFALAEYRDGVWNSRFYREGVLDDDGLKFFPEIFLECELELKELFPPQDLDILVAERGDDGWSLRWDRWGYLSLRRKKGGEILAITPLPPATYAGRRCRVAAVLSNVAHTARGRDYADEFFPYCRIRLLVARDLEGPLKLLKDVPLADPELPVVPRRWEIPAGSPLVSFTARNMSRHELLSARDDAGGPSADSDFTECGRVFSRYDAGTKVLKIFSGPEFVKSQSYWLYCRVRGAVPGQTMIRILMTSFCSMPNMAPVFFWSRDRVTWSRAVVAEPTDERDQFCPLLEAPAEEFFLATSIPFTETERAGLVSWAKGRPGIRVEEIGKSVGGIPIELLSASDWSVDDSLKKHFMLIIGQHSPQEMLGAHCARPLLESLLADAGLMKKAAVHIVPMVNVDAARWGGDGMNLDGWNLNRCWAKDIQPETRGLREWCLRQKHGFDYFMDIHAGGTWKNHTLLWFGKDTYEKHGGGGEAGRFERQERLLGLLGEHCGIRREDGFEFPFRGCGAKDWFLTSHPRCVPLDLEMSTCSNFDPRAGRAVEVGHDSLAMIGRGLKQVAAALSE